MKTDKKSLTKFSSFLKREMSITLLFWLVVFLIVAMMRIFGLI